MGHAFISFKESALRIRAASMGILCTIIVYESERWQRQLGERSKPVCRLVDDINKDKLTSGWTGVLDLTPTINNAEEAEEIMHFFADVKERLSSLEDPLPASYLKLTGYCMIEGTTWTRMEIFGLIDKVSALIAGSDLFNRNCS